MAVCVLGLCGLVLLGGRAVSIRRQARLHDFYAGWFARQAAAHLAAARDCEAYGGDSDDQGRRGLSLAVRVRVATRGPSRPAQPPLLEGACPAVARAAGRS